MRLQERFRLLKRKVNKRPKLKKFIERGIIIKIILTISFWCYVWVKAFEKQEEKDLIHEVKIDDHNRIEVWYIKTK